ncbi:MAG: hypothetical protein M1815_003081 [Lichina confinis]|nr:MAG: hypothetical protein M1815_003081 [Lichina confinis]
MSSLHPFRDINVHASPSHYAFTSPSSPLAPSLVVGRPSGDLRLTDETPKGSKRVSSIAGILGILKLRLDKYIIIITKAQAVGRLKGHPVYKIVATEFLQLRERPVHDPDEDACLSVVKTLIKSGPMYFSYSLDLTSSFQRQAHADLSLPLWQRADDRFFWNRFVQSDLIDFRSGGASGAAGRPRTDPQPAVDPYILPVLYGMLDIAKTGINKKPFTFALITRRSRHRAGTRYFSRGIDENGNVSNYNETEQLVVLNDSGAELGAFAGGIGAQAGVAEDKGTGETQILSYVQTRGSIPVFWAEVNDLRFTPKLQVRGVDSAVEAAARHFDEQIRLYGDNYLVNLVNHKGREQRVKEAYEQVVRTLVSSPEEGRQADVVTDEKIRSVEPSQRKQQLDRLHYVYFDFHNETKGLRWHRALMLLEKLRDGLEQQQYFRGGDMPGDLSGRMEIRNLQRSVVRTNCMDCLDRTNLVQSMLARWTLDRQLVDLGILQAGQSSTDDQSFTYLFRNVWADNADVVARSYSGSGAMKTDYTRTGNRTKAGMLKDIRSSISRYFQNNFVDGPKQDGFDIFLGAYLPPSSSSSNSGLFDDRRPILVQAVPYLLATSIFMITVATFTRRMPGSSPFAMRAFVLFWSVVGFWSFYFIRTHGALYVNWPKLNELPWAVEGYNEAMLGLQKDNVIGRLAGTRDRGFSSARLGHLEEGKKRIE